MTKEELEALVLFVRQHRSKGHPPYEAIVQLADERDRAQSLANAWGARSQEDEQRRDAAIAERDAALAALREEEKKTYAAMRETHDARLQRDRVLALLREQARGEQCEVAEATDDHEQDQGCMDTLDDDGIPRPDVNTACWEHRRRALLAEVYK